MDYNHKIAVVFNPHMGLELCDLMKKYHTWVIRSKENDNIIEWFIKQSGSEPLPHGITRFNDAKLTPDLLTVIWDHHDEFAHAPPLSDMVIFGVCLDDETIDLLREYGFTVENYNNELKIINVKVV